MSGIVEYVLGAVIFHDYSGNSSNDVIPIIPTIMTGISAIFILMFIIIIIIILIIAYFGIKKGIKWGKSQVK